MSDWSTRSLEFDQRALLRKLSDFEVPSLCGNLYLQLGCVTVSFWVITRLILVSYYTVLRYRISIICFFSHFVLSLCPIYTVFLYYCYFHYLFLAKAFLNHLNFSYIDIKISYLHLALTQIQCILACSPPVQMPCGGFGQTDLHQLHLCQFLQHWYMLGSTECVNQL